MRDHLEFRGSSTVLFGDILLLALLTPLTLGLYFPWGYARLRRTMLTHTYLDDQPLAFDGTGGEVFGVWVRVLLLSLITLGIYAVLMYPTIAMLKWETEHTILPGGRRLEYRGTALDLFGQCLVVSILSVVTLGIYGFWGYVQIRSHVLRNSFAGNERLEFTGTGGQYLGIALVNAILDAITFGIYELVGAGAVRQLRWDAANTLVPVQTYEGGGRQPGAEPSVQVNVTVNR